MNIQEFFDLLEKEIKSDKQAFINNTHNLHIHDKSFCEWIDLYIGWMEWGTDEDCEYYYINKDSITRIKEL